MAKKKVVKPKKTVTSLYTSAKRLEMLEIARDNWGKRVMALESQLTALSKISELEKRLARLEVPLTNIPSPPQPVNRVWKGLALFIDASGSVTETFVWRALDYAKATGIVSIYLVDDGRSSYVQHHDVAAVVDQIKQYHGGGDPGTGEAFEARWKSSNTMNAQVVLCHDQDIGIFGNYESFLEAGNVLVLLAG